MIKKFIYSILIVGTAVFAGQAGVQYSFQPPEGYTGADGSTCVDCHSSFGLNSGGGSVTASGLPSGMYSAGQQYNFSLTIAHPSNRTRWGFSIAARDGNNAPVGTFSSTNPRAALNGSELSHNNAMTQTGTSFTYNNLRWTAPSNPTAAQQNVTFYYVGNAANGNGNNDQDYIYANSTAVLLPIALHSFTGTVRGTTAELTWTTKSEQNASHFIVEKSGDNQHFSEAGTLMASNQSNGFSYSFTDDKPIFFETPTFYRLIMVDKDGSKRISNVVKLQLKPEGNYVKKMYPNPVKAGEQTTLQVFANNSGKATVEVLNFAGQKIKTETVSLMPGVNNHRITIGSQLPAGRYTVVLHTGTDKQHLPLLVK